MTQTNRKPDQNQPAATGFQHGYDRAWQMEYPNEPKKPGWKPFRCENVKPDEAIRNSFTGNDLDEFDRGFSDGVKDFRAIDESSLYASAMTWYGEAFDVENESPEAEAFASATDKLCTIIKSVYHLDSVHEMLLRPDVLAAQRAVEDAAIAWLRSMSGTPLREMNPADREMAKAINHHMFEYRDATESLLNFKR